MNANEIETMDMKDHKIPDMARAWCRLLAVLIVFFQATVPAGARVNLINGNFYISYTDLIKATTEDGQIQGKLEITRTYNSKSTYIGDFGYGWGYEFETHLVNDHEGGMVIHNNGGGSLAQFSRSNERIAQESCMRIARLDGLGMLGPITNHAWEQKGRMLNMESRQRIFVRAQNRRLLQPMALPHDWAMRVDSFCSQPDCLENHGTFLERTATGYRRKYTSGELQEFDENMKLILIQKSNGYFKRISRNLEGRITRIQDANGYRVDFETNEDGRIIGLRDSYGNTTEYRYQGNRLVWSRDIGGNIYGYEYDSSANMTRMYYEDGTDLQIEYCSRKDVVTQTVSRKGEITLFEYDGNPENPNHHYWTTEKVHDADGKLIDENRYEFELAVDGAGRSYQRRRLTERRLRGERDELLFAPHGILSREVNDQLTRYEYDPRYDVRNAILGPEEEVRMQFHPQRKVAVRKSILDVIQDRERVFEFEYSEDFERLMVIRDSDGPEMTFEHDGANRVSIIRREGNSIEWMRGRYGAIERVIFNGGDEWEIRRDKSALPHGFVIEGDLEEGERTRLMDWLGWLKTATTLTFCPEVLPIH